MNLRVNSSSLHLQAWWTKVHIQVLAGYEQAPFFIKMRFKRKLKIKRFTALCHLSTGSKFKFQIHGQEVGS